MTTFEIIIIILLGVVFIGLVVVLILLLRKKPEQVSSLDLKELGALENQIQNLSKEMKTNISLALADEMQKSNDAAAKQNERNNEKLERFQSNITDSLLKKFNEVNDQISKRLDEINKKVDEKLQEGFKGTSESMAQVRERLQAIDSAQKNIENLSKDVISLKQVLEGNQTRGQYGEYRLDMVLNSVFGDTIGCYEEQYTMKKVYNGEKVRADAVVFMPEPNKMICIDSKFPFQDYSRIFETNDENEIAQLNKDFASSVKKHITDIKNKYIIEGQTAPEAIMFIPNDGVFAYIHHNLEDVVEYAREGRVILTSPSTLPSILVTINMVRIEVERAKNAREITKQLQRLSKDFEMFGKEWERFSDQLDKATSGREKIDKRVGRITTKFEAIRSSNPQQIEGEDNLPGELPYSDDE